MALSKILENSITDGVVSSAKLKDFAAAVDLNGVELILDADQDTSITADTDDRIDFKIANTDHISIGTSSGDTVIKPMTDAKDIIFQQYDGNKILEINDGNYVGIGGNAAGAGEIRIYEDTDDGTHYTGFKAGNNTESIAYTLPTADAASSGQALVSNASGVLSWATVSANTPSSADGQALGSASLEWSDLYLADSSVIYFGADQDVTLTHNPDTGLTLNTVFAAASLDISGNIDVDGTTNLDAVDIDGAVQLDATLTIGANDQGYDVILYGDTASANMTWDTSVDDLIFNGAARIVVPDGQLVLGSTAVTSTAAELNIVDGGTSATSTTVADADRVVMNDNGTMVQVAVTDLAAYFDDEITAMPNLVTTAATTVGALNSGSITSGFGTIDTGSSTITTTGLISGGSLDIDNVLINGTTIGHTDDTDLMTVADGLLTVAGEVSMTTLDIGGTNITATAAEINLIDGGTARGTTAVADADGLLHNDGGTMRMTSAATFKTYFQSGLSSFDPDGAVTINESGADVDFRVESDNDANALFVQGSNGLVGIGTSSPPDGISLTVSNDGSGAHQPGIRMIDTNSGNHHQIYVNAGSIYFRDVTAGTTRMVINSSGVMSVPVGIELGSGVDATAANTLDDYEEGSFSPVFKVGGTDNVNSTLRSDYTKIGRQVTCYYQASLIQSTNGSGTLTITGLPFTSDSSYAVGTEYVSGNDKMDFKDVVGRINGTTVTFYRHSTSTSTNLAAVTNSDMNSNAVGKQIEMRITYTV